MCIWKHYWSYGGDELGEVPRISQRSGMSKDLGWESKFVNPAEKEVLINMVLMRITQYTMNLFFLLKNHV